MLETAAILSVFLPLFSGAINGLFARKISKCSASLVASCLMIAAAAAAATVFYNVQGSGQIIHVTIFKWLEVGSIIANWAIYVDQLTAIMFIVVIFVSTVVHIYSLGYMADDENLPKFLSFLSLFTFFMLSLVSADNFLQLFFGWEGVGLCSYLLIGYWYHKKEANDAAIKAFIANRVGDFAFILGIALIIIYFGAVDFKAVFAGAADSLKFTVSIMGAEIKVIDVICLLLFIGCTGKSAQIGLHVWLPDAMEGPTPVSALIHAATMVTAGVFLIARCSFMFEHSPSTLYIITLVGGVTCLFAASIAIAGSDIKKIIAYSTCSQLGYMFLACGVSAYQAGIFHLVTHAFFKALLFLSAGSVIHACHEQDIFKMGNLRKRLPITYLNFWIGSLAIIGIFPLAGYYSKDLILESAYTAGTKGYLAFWMGIVAAVFTAIYSMKIIYLTFHGKTRLADKVYGHAHEAPLIMNAPLIILAAGAVFAGLVGVHYLHMNDRPGYFADSLFYLAHEPGEHHIARHIEMLPLIVGISGMLVGLYAYKSKAASLLAGKIPLLHRLLENKYYFDEIYSVVIVRPLSAFSRFLGKFDKKVVDGFGPEAFAKLVNLFGGCASGIQTGYIFNYALVIILSLAACITYFVINYARILG